MLVEAQVKGMVGKFFWPSEETFQDAGSTQQTSQYLNLANRDGRQWVVGH
jgi:hypothetical protein